MMKSVTVGTVESEFPPVQVETPTRIRRVRVETPTRLKQVQVLTNKTLMRVWDSQDPSLSQSPHESETHPDNQNIFVLFPCLHRPVELCYQRVHIPGFFHHLPWPEISPGRVLLQNHKELWTWVLISWASRGEVRGHSGSRFNVLWEQERAREGGDDAHPVPQVGAEEEGGGGGDTMYCWPLNASLTFDLVFIETRCETSTAGDEEDETDLIRDENSANRSGSSSSSSNCLNEAQLSSVDCNFIDLIDASGASHPLQSSNIITTHHLEDQSSSAWTQEFYDLIYWTGDWRKPTTLGS